MRTKVSLMALMRGSTTAPRQYVVNPIEATCGAALQCLVPAIAGEPKMTTADVANHAARYITELDAEMVKLMKRLRQEQVRQWRLTHWPCGKAKIRRTTPGLKAARDQKRRRVITDGENRLRDYVPTLAERSPRQNIASEAARYIEALRAALTPDRLRNVDAAFRSSNKGY